MRYTNSGLFDGSTTNTAIFIDYGNLYDVMSGRAPSGTDIHEVLLELVEDIYSNLADRKHTPVSTITAYADFSEYSDDSAQTLHLLASLGIDPRFVSNAMQANAAELQLCVDAADILCSHPEIRAVVILSGDRLYLPVLQLARRYGRHAEVVLLDRTPESRQLPFLQDSFDDVSTLLSQDKRSLLHHQNGLGRAAGWGYRSNGHSKASIPEPEMEPQAAPRPVHRHLTDALCITALEIIDEYFGQYDEIYLTPLLRKLSEELGEANCDPKTLVSELEQVGAVWLEKRRGFPHDYTVLLLDRNHPDLQRILQEDRPNRQTERDETYGYERSASDSLYE